MLALRGIQKSYRPRLLARPARVLDGIDLELARGRVLGLAGPNGSGKSTLLRLVTGVERPDAGTIAVLGLAPRIAASQGRIGWLPEESPFPPELTLREGLELAGSLHDMAARERRERAAELLERVGLADQARKPLGRASRGMQRRFGLAQAWLHRPELVLLDEPTAGLDAQGFEVLAGFLDESRAAGTTVVLASHLPGDLLERCDELAVIIGGRIAEHGAPRAILGERGLLDVYRRHAAVAR